jgi:hypothetical protein
MRQTDRRAPTMLFAGLWAFTTLLGHFDPALCAEVEPQLGQNLIFLFDFSPFSLMGSS